MKKTVLITGANRGLGFAVGQSLQKQGYNLVVTSRKIKNLKKGDWPNAVLLELDVSSQKSLQKFLGQLVKKKIQIDILINNAGIVGKSRHSLFAVQSSDLLSTFKTNTLGPFSLTNYFLPQMIRQGYGRVVNVTSEQGAFHAINSKDAAYRVSKTALNALTKIFADAATLSKKDVLVNSVCPGWISTDMGGKSAPRSVEKGVEGVVWAATLPSGGPNGGFFLDSKPVQW